MSKTVFSKIIHGELPATKVFEDKKSLAFLDINPVTKGHTLLIPKEEYVWIQDVPDDLLCHLFLTSKTIIKAMKTGLSADFVQLSVVGIDVPHFHIHLIPRYFDDGIGNLPATNYEEGEPEKFAEKISTALKELQ